MTYACLTGCLCPSVLIFLTHKPIWTESHIHTHTHPKIHSQINTKDKHLQTQEDQGVNNSSAKNTAAEVRSQRQGLDFFTGRDNDISRDDKALVVPSCPQECVCVCVCVKCKRICLQKWKMRYTYSVRLTCMLDFCLTAELINAVLLLQEQMHLFSIHDAAVYTKTALWESCALSLILKWLEDLSNFSWSLPQRWTWEWKRAFYSSSKCYTCWKFAVV